MKPDINGYIYPTINSELCLKCGVCKDICAFQNIPVNGDEPINTYVAINKNESVLKESASGGVFAALASIILEKNGVAFGCSFNRNMEPEHICINNLSDIKKLQGSKYVQSNINNTYSEAKKYLEDGIWVLFTGTPCQIAGLKSYIGKEYENLITVDLICHGVPSAIFFKGYIEYLQDKLNGKIIDFKFRDKSKGWGLMGKAIYENNGIVKEKLIHPLSSYYYSYFLDGDIYRENCYECKYACSSREGDFTIGDYWGIEKIHPNVETKKGVSVLLVNTQKGTNLVCNLKKYLNLIESDFQSVKLENSQLSKPTNKSSKRQLILKTWRQGGWRLLADEYYKSNKIKIIISRFKIMIPESIKSFIKKLLKRG